MGIFQAFINRPVMATAVNLVLLIIGLVAFNHLELRHTSSSARNEFSITTHFPGANNITVEQRITKTLEDVLSGLDGIKSLSSDSSDGQSQIHIKFKKTINPNVAVGELRDRVFGAVSSLPENIKRPEILEVAENSKPLMYMMFEDNTRSVASLSDYIRRVVEDRLRLVEGVAKVEFMGDKFYQVSILIDPARLAEHHVTVKEVVDVLRREKSFASGGEIEKESGKKTVVLTAAVQVPSEFAEITIKTTPEGRIRIGDVAEIAVTERPSFLRMRVDGRYIVGLQIYGKPQANPLQVSKRLNSFVNDLNHSLPPSMKASITFDATKPFEASISAIQHTLWEAIILVGIIVTLSLASIRAALFPMITVPLCLIGSFALMWLFGFSVNPITLLALVLAVGLVVDDAIVVVENIHHHMESGLTPLQAARAGMKEITFAVIVMTLTLAAVYMPVAFQTDDSAVMFKEFAWTLAGSVIISGFVALTLTPALCGQFLKHGKRMSAWDRLTEVYRRSLSKSLAHPRLVCTFAIIIALLGVWGFLRLPSELMPIEDEDYISGNFDFENALPESVRLGWLTEVEKIFASIPERDRIFTGDWQQRWLWWGLALKPSLDRDRGIQKITKELQEKLNGVVGPKVSAQIGEGTGVDGDDSLKVIIQYSADYKEVVNLVKAIIEEASQLPQFQRLVSDSAWEISRLKVDVDRAFADEMGVSAEAIEDTLYTFLSGRKANTFSFHGFDYDVQVQAALEHRSEWNTMDQFFVAGSENQLIPLGSFVTLKEVNEPNMIKHFERMRGAVINVTLKPDTSLEQAMQVLEPVILKHLPADAHYRFGGKAEKYQEARNAMWLTYALSLIFIYLVLTALFESFVHPFVVLLTVPLSVTGAMWAVNLAGGSNNIFTAIGLVTLVGLITKHGILIVDFANRLRMGGMSILAAVKEAATRRLRPILMTTFAMVFGAIPLLYSVGAFANARLHIGLVIIGGMIFGTIFSLYVVPVAYILLARRQSSHSH